MSCPLFEVLNRGRRPFAYAPTSLIVIGLMSCGASTPTPDVAPANEEIVVAVTNNTLARLRVHAQYGESEPMLLGEISTHRTRAFMVPWQTGGLRIGVRRSDSPVQEPRWSSNALTVAPGDSLEFTLTANARRTAEVMFRKVGTRGGL